MLRPRLQNGFLAGAAVTGVLAGISGPASACPADCRAVRTFSDGITVPGDLVYFKVLRDEPGPLILKTVDGKDIPVSIRMIGPDRVFAPPVVAGTSAVASLDAGTPSASTLNAGTLAAGHAAVTSAPVLAGSSANASTPNSPSTASGCSAAGHSADGGAAWLILFAVLARRRRNLNQA